MKTKNFIILITLILFSSCSSVDKKSNINAENYYNWGTESLIAKDYSKAVYNLRLAVKENPEYSDAHNNLGMAYYFKKEQELAMKHLQTAYKLNPQNTDALSNIASIHFENNDLVEAEKKFKKCLEDLTYEKNARVYYNLALIKLRQKNLPEAQKHLQASVEATSTYCPAWFTMGKLYYENKDYKKAYNSFINAGKGPCSSDPAPVYWQGVTLMKMSDYLKARLKFDELDSRFIEHSYKDKIAQKLSEISYLENQKLLNSNNPTTNPSF